RAEFEDTTTKLQAQTARAEASEEHQRLILLDHLKTRISKSERLLEKTQQEHFIITQDRIDKHQDEVDLITAQWKRLQHTPDQREAFDLLVFRWHEIRIELDHALSKEDENVSSRLPTQSVIPESPSSELPPSGAFEEAIYHGIPPEIPSPDSTPPNSPSSEPKAPVSEQVKSHQDSESPTSTHKIFALLNRKGSASQNLSNKDLFEQINGDYLIRINFPEAKTLTEEEAREFLATGTKVTSPANHTYTLGIKEGKPWASLAKKDVPVEQDETTEQRQQRLALTVMNMVENILSKGTVINIKTKDPFIAKVADQYINHLKQTGISISKYNLTGVELNDAQDPVIQAQKTFEKMKPKYSQKELESKAPWYQEAQAYRAKLQEKITQEQTQSSSHGPRGGG
ncbi:hypothetical protein, partial [Legionella impletisoli]